MFVPVMLMEPLLLTSKASGYRIMNGRVDKDNSSTFTCFANKGNSVVDYALLRQEHFSMVEKLTVGELCELSHHSPIEITSKSSNFFTTNDMPSHISEVIPTTSDENKLFQDYKKQYYINDDPTLEILSVAMESNEINSFHKYISNQLDNDDPQI